MLSLAIILLFGLAANLEAADWSHADKDNWATLYPEFCAGSSQSPINLDTKIAVTPATDPGAIKFSGYDVKGSAKISNNGHGAVFAFDTFNPVISGGRLPAGDSFQFLSLHWHWGSDSTKGSEHTIDGKEFPLELHMIHWNTKYGTVSDALAYSDGLAVLGFMYEVSSADNGNLATIVSALPSVALTKKKRKNKNHKNQRAIRNRKFDKCDICDSYSILFAPYCKTDCPQHHAGSDPVALAGTFSLNQFLPSTGAGDAYFYYSGGLTTPMCNEIVLWTNFVTKNTISESQLKALRALKDGAGTGTVIVDNYRVPQPLNGRTLNLRSGTTATAAAATGALGISGLTLGAAIGAVVAYFVLGSEMLATLLDPSQLQRSYRDYYNPIPQSFNQNYENY